jgi:hypothetical protein
MDSKSSPSGSGTSRVILGLALKEALRLSTINSESVRPPLPEHPETKRTKTNNRFPMGKPLVIEALDLD